MIHRLLGLSIAGLAICATAARAQGQTQPSEQARTAAARQLVKPSGVGGCIYYAVPNDVRHNALVAVLSHGKIGDILRAPVAAVAQGCTGRPYSASDGALIAAVTATFLREGAAMYLAERAAIAQPTLDAAWAAASPADKAPFVASAESFLSPQAAFAKAPDAAVAPFEQRLQLDPKALDAQAQAALHMYFTAAALSDEAEAKLAAEGAHPPA